MILWETMRLGYMGAAIFKGIWPVQKSYEIKIVKCQKCQNIIIIKKKINFYPSAKHLAKLPLPSVCPPMQILSGPVLRHYIWYLFHNVRTYQLYMELVHCQIILTFWPSALKLWPSPWLFCSDDYLETVHGNCFILSRYINLPWDLCTVGLFWPLTLTLWQLPWKPWWPSPSKSCLGQYSETIHDSRFILSSQMNLAWHMYIIRLFLPFDL